MSSWLANATGVHISPHRTYVDPKQLTRAALVAGGSALLPGTGGAIASKLPIIGSAADWLKGKMGGGNPGAPPADGNDPLGILGEWNAQQAQNGGTSGGGALGWLQKLLGGNVSGGDVLKAGGAAVGGYMDAEQQARLLAEKKREFDAQQGLATRQTGDTEAQQAVQAQTALNKAPLADNAQALLRARMAAPPTTFQPRDYTQGVEKLTQAPTGGPSTITDAQTKAASAYTPGSGGVNTDTLKLLLAKMRGSSGLAPTPGY